MTTTRQRGPNDDNDDHDDHDDHERPERDGAPGAASHGPSRRRLLQAAAGTAVAAATVGAPAITRLVGAPSYAAAASAPLACPGPVRMLGWYTKNTQLDSEIRADFIIQVPTGVSPTNISYRYTSTATGTGTTATAISATITNDINNTYRIVARTPSSATCDLVAISLQGDADHPSVTCTTPVPVRPNRIQVNLPAPYAATPITFGADSLALSGGFDVDLYTTVNSAGCSKPSMRLPWDTTWPGYPGGYSSQSGWGFITTTGITPGVFVVHPYNASTGTSGSNCSGATATTAGRTIKVWYQWVKETAPGTFTAATALVDFDGTNSTTPTAGSSFAWVSQNFATLGPGYYKLLAWPQAVDAGGAPCTPGRVLVPGTIDDAWTIGSVFYNYVPSL